MRVGTTILLLDGYCYQSYNWKRLRPLGDIQNILDLLEEYHCDEISIIRPIRQKDDENTLKKDIEIMGNIKSLTPISFGGGLRTKNHIDILHKLPIERLIFNSAFCNKDKDLLTYVKELFGHQAIQAIIPFKIEKNKLFIFNSSLNNFVFIEDFDLSFVNEWANEIILFDTLNEGLKDSFIHDILDMINIEKSKLIISGGIGQKDIALAKKQKLASVLLDNKTLHNEFSIKDYKNAK